MSRYTKSNKKTTEEEEEEPSEEVEFEDPDEVAEEGEGEIEGEEKSSEEEEEQKEEETESIEPVKKLKSKSRKDIPKGSPIKTKKTLKSKLESKPKGSPIKTKKSVTIKEKPTTTVKKGIYPFDTDFLRYYNVFLKMLKDRGYNFDRPGLGYVPGIEQREDSDKVRVNVIPTTAIALEKEFGGLENFKLVLTHENEDLNLLVYYLPPEVEAKSASAPRKQIAADQIRKALQIFEENDYPRLILLARTKLAIQAAELIKNANNQIIEGKPERLIQFFNMEVDFAFNFMESRYQSKIIKILRTEDEQTEYLSQLTIDEQQTDKRRALPIIYNTDPVTDWFGLKINDIVLFKRVNSPSITFSLRVTRPPEELS